MANDTIFRDAFQRLKDGKPTRVPRGTPVTQNMVAKEAGREPPAFKKSRYPELIAEIQKYVAARQEASDEPAVQVPATERRPKRSMEEKYRDMKSQRDIALSLLVEADALILELTQQLDSIEAARPQKKSNVTPIAAGRKKGKGS
jgi:hypothetical protein